MDFVFKKQGRGIKVLVDGKHRKTIPSILSLVFVKNIKKIDFDKKRLSAEERKTLERSLLFDAYLNKLAYSQPHLYDLVKDSTPTAARKVITPDNERLELQLDNGLKITCSSTRLFKLFPHTSDAYLNY